MRGMWSVTNWTTQLACNQIPRPQALFNFDCPSCMIVLEILYILCTYLQIGHWGILIFDGEQLFVRGRELLVRCSKACGDGMGWDATGGSGIEGHDWLKLHIASHASTSRLT